jgi:hypothetical protein
LKPCPMPVHGAFKRCTVFDPTQKNVGAGLPAIAVYQPTYSVTDIPPSRASPAPTLDLQWI